MAPYARLCLALPVSCIAIADGGSRLPVVIAVGDSITEGHGASARGQFDYPARLSECLKTHVRNFGVGGATMQKLGDKPYWDQAAYQQALSSSPDIVYLMLGTNDAKWHNWNERRFRDDASAMVASFRDLQSNPTVHLASPPPLFRDGAYDMNQTVINAVLPVILQDVASKSGPNVKFCDAAFKVFGGDSLSCHSCMYDDVLQRGDGCHPVDYGYAQMALSLCIATSTRCSCADAAPIRVVQELWRVAELFQLLACLLLAALVLVGIVCLCYCWRSCRQKPYVYNSHFPGEPVPIGRSDSLDDAIGN